MNRKLSLLVIVVLLFTAVPVFAGGWAVVSMDDLPSDIRAGEPTEFDFMVRQHGETPVHFLDAEHKVPITPILTATNSETGESLRIEAVRGEEVGRFTIEVTFPSEGLWEWTISPDPLGGEGVFPTLTVLAPVTASTTVKEAAGQPAVVEPAVVVPANEETAVESAAPATQIETAPAVTTPSAEPMIRSGLQWAAIALLVVAIALLVVQRRSASTAKLGTQGSGD